MNARTRCGLCAVAGMMSVAAVVAVAAQSGAASEEKQKPKNEVITLTGCVERVEKAAPTQYTIEDTATGIKYRLTGTTVRDYVGKPVLIVGGSNSKKLVVVGGLTPNPNVAAQAGSMDPVRQAMAAQPGVAGPGTVDLPEFKVKSVKPGTGGCR